jgi:hypothetical protein
LLRPRSLTHRLNARRPLLLTLLLFGVSAFASEIREFDLKTLERLGNELVRTSQRPDRGATDPVRKRALQTAKTAIKGKLFDASYDSVVLNDPDGSGFLVYALALADTKRMTQTGGHFRVTVSADGGTVERIDLLSAFIQQKLEKGKELAAIVSSPNSSNLPAETWIYTSHVYRIPVALVTKDGGFWTIDNGKIHKLTKAEVDALEYLPVGNPSSVPRRQRRFRRRDSGIQCLNSGTPRQRTDARKSASRSRRFESNLPAGESDSYRSFERQAIRSEPGPQIGIDTAAARM